MSVLLVLIQYFRKNASERAGFVVWRKEQHMRKARIAAICADVGMPFLPPLPENYLYDEKHRLLVCQQPKVARDGKSCDP
jgi:hypothetical protein